MLTHRYAIAAAALVVAVAAPLAAQRGVPCSPGAGRGAGPGAGAIPYDTSTVTSLGGTVERIDTIAAPGRGGGGVQLVLRTGTAALPVHLGPVAYLRGQALRLAKGDRITVRGSRVTVAGQSTLLAAEVTRGARTLVLRDARGIPEWVVGRPCPRATAP